MNVEKPKEKLLQTWGIARRMYASYMRLSFLQLEFGFDLEWLIDVDY